VPNRDHAEKVDLCESYWNPKRKMGVAMQFFEILSLESLQKCWHQHFSEKRRKNISSPISIEFAFTYRKVSTVLKF